MLVELVAPKVALSTWMRFLRGRTCLILKDSTSAEGILIKGYSNQAEDANEMVGNFWTQCAEGDVCTYIDRIPTDSNPSDGASRGRACEDALRYDWELVRPAN